MLKFLVVFTISVLSFSGFSAERIVILSPGAGDIVERLGAEQKVVGVTKSLEGFDKAVRVGSHIKPNVEIIRSLNPDLLIVSGGKYFTDEMRSAVGVKAIVYDPRSLDEVLEGLKTIGKELSKADVADSLAKSLKNEISGLKNPACSPRVFYEVSQMPLMAAGNDSIIGDSIKRAGGYLVPASDKKLYKTNIETVLTSKPDIYIWQTGAMNRNPVPPKDRGEYQSLKAVYVHVDEYDFSRANTQSFKNVIFLNRAFSDYCKSR